MTSPSKINASNLVPSDEISYKSLNFDRYVDLENELTNEEIAQFIQMRAGQYKERLIEKVIYFISCSLINEKIEQGSSG